jgi:hypothetical protein
MFGATASLAMMEGPVLGDHVNDATFSGCDWHWNDSRIKPKVL